MRYLYQVDLMSKEGIPMNVYGRGRVRSQSLAMIISKVH